MRSALYEDCVSFYRQYVFSPEFDLVRDWVPPATALCAASTARSAACPGDMGGPLVTQGAQPEQVKGGGGEAARGAAGSRRSRLTRAGCNVALGLQSCTGARTCGQQKLSLQVNRGPRDAPPPQVGIASFISWNQICGGAGNFGGYTDVRKVRGWIQDTLAAGP